MMHNTAIRARRALIATGAVAALVLAGCAADPEGASSGGDSGGGEGGEGGTIRVAYLATGSSLPLFVTAEK